MTDKIHPIVARMGDTRELLEVRSADLEDYMFWKVGKVGCKRITAYCECGEMSPVPYVQIVMDDGTEHRMAARHLVVTFKTDEPKEVTQ